MAETIGSLVDKLSIVELKIHHMNLQTMRADASVEHKQKCQNRLIILNEQKKDLSEELNVLAGNVLSGKQKMKVYRQFKMYNDAQYKPHLANQ